MYTSIKPRMAIILAALLSSASAVDNGLARTPQMGWNNWNSLGCDVSQDLLIETSAKLVHMGLRDVGYNYVVLDDCWSDGRGKDGYVKVDQQRFPNGMKWVAEQIHNQGLLYGMYSSAGQLTCARYEGSLDWEKQDATSFASWDVDYLKYDNCYPMGRSGTAEVTFNRYNAMAKALNETGRPILYSLCNWGEDFVNSWGVSIANSWRISGDIYDHFNRPDDLCSCTSNDPSAPFCVAPGSRCSVMSIMNRVAPYVDRGQPGGWQDLDMLEVGHGGMSDEEYKAHFAIWSALKSPLLIGADLRHIDSNALSILNNPAIIAISQDPLGRSATRVHRDLNVAKDRWGEGETNVWSGPLYGGDQFLMMLNAADKDLTMTASLEDIFVGEGPGGSAVQVSEVWDVYDLWANRMDKDVAEKIVALKSASGADTPAEEGIEKIYASINWYNSTEIPYKEGLKARDTRLMGKKVGEIKAKGSWKVKVPRHSAMIYRLVNQAGIASKRYSVSRDEL